MMALVVESKNRKVEATLSELQEEEALEDDTKLYVRTTDKCELYAVFALIYFRGLLGGNHHSVGHVFL